MKHSAEGWWIEEAGAPAPCAALSGSIDADVVIVGAGYLGMWTAWNLLARDNDLNIVMLESGLAGHGPSGAVSRSRWRRSSDQRLGPR